MSGPRESIRILVADDESKVRDTYRSALADDPVAVRPGSRPERRAHPGAPHLLATGHRPHRLLLFGGSEPAHAHRTPFAGQGRGVSRFTALGHL